MRTKQKATDVRGFLPKIFYPGLTPTERQRLLGIHIYLEDGPRTTVEIVKHCSVNSGDVTQVLNYGFRAGTLKKESQRGYKGRGKRPKKWWNDIDGMHAKADEKLPPGSPLDLIDDQQRAKLLRMDPAECGVNPRTKKPVTAHELYCVAELCAAIQLFPDLCCYDLAKRLDVHYTTFRHRAKLAEHIGVITVQRPKRENHAGTPNNSLQNNSERIDKLSASKHELHPARSKKKVIDLTPKNNRCTVEQRRWLGGITAKDAKLSAFDHQAMTRVLFPSFGTERITTYPKLAEELGCGVTALEKPIRRLKAKGWIEVEKDAGGHGGRETAFRPTWERTELVYNRLHRRNGKRKASTNGHAKIRSAPKAAKVDAPPPPPAKPSWDDATGILRFGKESRKVAEQAKNVRVVLNKFQTDGWPTRINTPFPDNETAHRDTIKSLNRCGFIRFSSVRATEIAWQRGTG